MGIRTGLGPVFEAECLTASRRAAFYAARVVLVAGLMVGLGVVWLAMGPASTEPTMAELARFGRSCFVALMGFELCMALVVAPAATAGAICQDRAGGGLALLMTTTLTDAEIVLGRLASRLLSMLGVVACGLPVLALATLLGGVDPVAVAGGTLVVVGVACLSVALALAFSLWAGKPHEALSATYAAWAVWLLMFLVCSEAIRSTPGWVLWSNPFWLLFGDRPIAERLPGQARFFGGCLAMTAGLSGLAAWRLRSVTFRHRGASARPMGRRAAGPAWLRRIGQGAPALDDDPILWREWHRRRPSAFGRAIWWTYGVLAALATAAALLDRDIASGVAGFEVSIGLLLASVGAATALAEERAQGGLDVVLTTPLDSRSIVLGKWWGAFRVVPRLAILPAILAIGTACKERAGHQWPGSVAVVALVVGLILAYGAAITGLGLVLAIARPKQGRAVALTVACYLGITVAYPAVVLPMLRDMGDLAPTWGSPFFGMFVPMIYLAYGDGGPARNLGPWRAVAALGAVATVALILRGVALSTFDRGVGRAGDRPRSAIKGRGG